MEKNDLIEVVERLRRQQFPHLPPELIEEIIESRFQTSENRVEAFRALRKIVNRHAEQAND